MCTVIEFNFGATPFMYDLSEHYFIPKPEFVGSLRNSLLRAQLHRMQTDAQGLVKTLKQYINSGTCEYGGESSEPALLAQLHRHAADISLLTAQVTEMYEMYSVEENSNL